MSIPPSKQHNQLNDQKPLVPVTKGQVRRARLRLAEGARDADELRVFLDVVGLGPEVQIRVVEDVA